MKAIAQILGFTLAVASIACATPAKAQDTIAYFNGPKIPFTFFEGGGGDLDVNADGRLDFNFNLSPFICTADIPVSGCSGTFSVTASGSAAMLVQRFSRAAILPFGTPIGSSSPTNSSWSANDPSASVATYFFSPLYGTSGFGGPLGEAGVGYLGIRFSAEDGTHYGWVRVCLLAPNWPAVVDWAYERRPDTAIAAGAIGTGNSARQFLVSFANGGNGSMILNGNTLRSEFVLAEPFLSASLHGPAPVHARSKNFISIGSPLLLTADKAALLGDTTLSQSDVNHLLRGANYVSLDDGRVIGTIQMSR